MLSVNAYYKGVSAVKSLIASWAIFHRGWTWKLVGLVGICMVDWLTGWLTNQKPNQPFNQKKKAVNDD